MGTMIRGERLREARQARGLTQRKLAEAVDVDPAYISKLERDVLPGATVAILARLAQALGVSTDYLLGLTDSPQPCNSTGKQRR